MPADSLPRTYSLSLTSAEAALLHHYTVLGAATFRGEINTVLYATGVLCAIHASADGKATTTSLFAKMKAFLGSMPDEDLKPWL